VQPGVLVFMNGIFVPSTFFFYFNQMD